MDPSPPLKSRPHAVPKVVAPAPRPVSEDEASRHDFRKHEGAVRGIGILYFAGTTGFLASTIGMGGFMEFAMGFLTEPWIAAASFIAFGILVLLTALGLRRLKPEGRITAIVLSCLCAVVAFLIPQPVGIIVMVVQAYILFVLFSPKSTVVCSPWYRSIVAATPQLKSRTPIAVWLLLGLMVYAALIVFGLVPSR